MQKWWRNQTSDVAHKKKYGQRHDEGVPSSVPYLTEKKGISENQDTAADFLSVNVEVYTFSVLQYFIKWIWNLAQVELSHSLF